MRLALAQTDIIWEDKKANMLTAEKMTAEASEKGCDIIIFPEVALTGFTMNLEKMAEPADDSESIRFFSNLASEYKIYITFGAALIESDGKVRNRAITIDDNGKVISSYAKIHPFSYGVEAAYFTGGDSVEWFDIKGVTASTFICYDTRFPEIFQAASKESRLIIVIASWPNVRTRYFDMFLPTRAIECQSFIAGVNRVGKEMKFDYIGHSQVVNPTGDVLTEISEEEKLIICDIDISEVDKTRSFYHLKQDRRPDVYKKYL